jgi:UDP-N-acetylglucosamine:LPS N-acetylglucosamine transferase
LVVAMQFDPFGPDDGKHEPFVRCTAKPAYRAFCTELQTPAARLDKPVLLIHGGTSGVRLLAPLS